MNSHTPSRIRTSLILGAVVASLLALLAVLLPGTQASATRPYDDRQQVRAAMQREADGIIKQGAPGVIAELDTPRGDITVRSGYGNREKRTPVPWGAHFRIASFTKAYVATTVMQLVGEGKLSLDDKVEKHLPGLIRGKGNDGRTITVRQVLQHQSGLPDYLGGMTYLFNAKGFFEHRFETVTARQAIDTALGFDREFKPGTKWSYSNTNYVLAGLLIESATGNSWRSEVRERIIEPLGLKDTYVPGTRTGLPKPHATAYERFPGEGATPEDPRYGRFFNVTRLNPTYGQAAGEMISTTDDSNRFLQALMRGELLKPKELAAMKTTVATSPEMEGNWPGIRYGLGLDMVPTECGPAWGHGGDIQGFMTRNGVTDDGSRAITVSTNTDSLKPLPGVEKAKGDVTLKLIEDALCSEMGS